MTDGDHPFEDLPTPSPGLGPDEAVWTQLDALEHNDDPVPDAGVRTAYNFASPANRRSTGPFDRFRRMVHGRRYRPMVDFEEAVAGPVERGPDGDVAVQRVTVTGTGDRTVTYVFRLSRGEDEYEGCWLTDAVTAERDVGSSPVDPR